MKCGIKPNPSNNTLWNLCKIGSKLAGSELTHVNPNPSEVNLSLVAQV